MHVGRSDPRASGAKVHYIKNWPSAPAIVLNESNARAIGALRAFVACLRNRLFVRREMAVNDGPALRFEYHR
ncbi:MAG: hypothetical protein DCC66_12400 [Planctomycetota bacterium]|nr:MAG: hypothetical protein DCC66_12400 [Planctomycetota bacterium]